MSIKNIATAAKNGLAPLLTVQGITSEVGKTMLKDLVGDLLNNLQPYLPNEILTIVLTLAIVMVFTPPRGRKIIFLTTLILLAMIVTLPPYAW